MSVSRSVRRVRLSAAFAFLLGAAVSCSSSTSLAPFQPQISNAADNFQLQATGVANVATTLTYSWSNSGTRATINHSTVTTAGSTLLVIRDGAGATVYSKALSASLNDPLPRQNSPTIAIIIGLNFSNN